MQRTARGAPAASSAGVPHDPRAASREKSGETPSLPATEHPGRGAPPWPAGCLSIARISRFIHADRGDPAQWHLFATPGDTYLQQMCSGRKEVVQNPRTGRTAEVWRPVASGAANHYLDGESYATAAASMLYVASMRPEASTARKRGVKPRFTMPDGRPYLVSER